VWALGSLYSRRAPSPSPIRGAAMQMLAGGVLLAAAGAARGEVGELRLSSVSATSLAALAYLTVVGSLLAFTAYVWLLRAAPTSLVGTYAYVNPVIAVLLGAAVLDEGLSARTLAGGAVVIVAVMLIVTRPAARPGAAVTVPARGG
jgi:drug/metabolite transporter (DMT)-like permease